MTSEPSNSDPNSLTSPTISVSLTHAPLDIPSILSSVKSPSAGANVLFLGTTRDTFDSRPVARLTYQAYIPLALKSFFSIAETVLEKRECVKACIVHRLGEVPVGEESIAIAVSSPHRAAGWRAGEEMLERCKERAEVWKREEFVGEDKGEGAWRANEERDGEGKAKSDKE